jgi:hypothetical protein
MFTYREKTWETIRWSYYIYNYLSPLMLWVRFPPRAKCTTLCDKSLLVTCDRSVVFSGSSGFLHQKSIIYQISMLISCSIASFTWLAFYFSGYIDFTPGVSILDNIVDAIHSSYKVILVLTDHFFSSQWCQYEADQAIIRSLGLNDEVNITWKIKS